MEAQAFEVLQLLGAASVTTDAKVSRLTSLKSEIKQKHVPEAAVSNCFEITRKAILSPHSSLSNIGFSLLTNLLKRLNLQRQYNHIAAQGHKTYPVLLERLGDSKERIRAQSSQGFTDFWTSLEPDARPELEKTVLDAGLTNKSARTKETSLVWLNRMAKEHGLLFRPYLSNIVSCLEDADPGVRETAKATIVDIMRAADGSVSARALSDLKKHFERHGVRKAMTTSILSLLERDHFSASQSSTDYTQPEMLPPRPHTRAEGLHPQAELPRQDSTTSTRSIASAHAHSKSDTTNEAVLGAHLPKGDPPRKDAVANVSLDDPVVVAPSAPSSDHVDPMYVNSNRELDEVFRNMEPDFEGKESEQNWLAREKHILALRRITKGNAPSDFYSHYVIGMKGVLDGILKTTNSLRTTLSTRGCTLIQEIAKTIGPGLDPMVEILLQNMIKLCGGTKKISAQNGNVTVDAIIGNVSYKSSILQHLWAACQDKNVQPRSYVTGWLQTFITKHGRQAEHGGGVDVIEKCIKKGLNDANPGVREGMRGTYWTFASVWPDRAENIMATLDGKYRDLLERHAANPNASVSSHGSTAIRPSFSKSVTSVPSRPSLKETIAAQKKARLAGKDIPPRPESAQSALSETKTVSASAHRPALTTSSSARPLGAAAGATPGQTGSLSSAPMRPPTRPLGAARRPEISRPATADPYSARRPGATNAQSKTSSPNQSPSKSKAKAAVLPSKEQSPVKSKPRKPEAGGPHSVKAKPQLVEGFVTTQDLRGISTPGMKLGKSRQLVETVSAQSPTASYEDFTMVMPQGKPRTNTMPSSPRDLEVRTRNLDQTPPRKSDDPFQDNHPFGSARKELSISEDRRPRTSTGIPRPAKYHSPSSSDDFSNAQTLKVYEDPDPPERVNGDATEAIQFTPKAVKALEELPVNEPGAIPFRRLPSDERDFRSLPPVREQTNENTHRRWHKVEANEKRRSISPRSKDPAQARVMLDKGIEKIRAKTLDVHGYRKLQGLIKFHDNIFVDEAKYDEMLLALLDSLETPNDEKRTVLGRPVDVKTQILVTVRLMLIYNRQYFAAYYPRTMSAVVAARRHYDSSSHIVSGLEETAEDIASVCSPPEVIDAVLNLIETEPRDEGGNRTIAMGLHVLTGLLHRVNEKQMYMDGAEEDRLGKLAFRSLREDHADVRRAVIEYCSELRVLLKPEERFWALTTGGVEDFQSLLSYFFEKQRRPVRA